MKVFKKAPLLLLLFLVLFASTALAAEEPSGGSWTAWMMLWRVIDFLACVVLIAYFVKKPLSNFFSERQAQIRKDLEDAREQRDRAERTIGEYEKKISQMEQELEKMRGELRKAADAESVKVVSNADRMATSMIEAARLAAEQEVRKARIALRNESVDLGGEIGRVAHSREDKRRRPQEDCRRIPR